MYAEFEKKIIELGFSYKCNTAGLYILYKKNDTDCILNAQLICSEPVEESKLGSRNGNVIQSIGHFKLNLLTEVKDQWFLILAFQNTNNHCVEFIIITKNEFLKRLNKENRFSTDNRVIDIVFWLMPDTQLYECSDLSVEGEWYFLSKGVNGRMADGTDWDYSEFLNAWERLKTV